MNFNLLNLSYLKTNLSLDLDIDKKIFIEKFQNYIDYDRGYFADELYSTKKPYLGKIDSDGFIIRKKRKFMIPTSPANADGKVLDINGKTQLEIEIIAYDSFAGLGLIIAPIFFLILIATVIINEAYPALILLIPFSILFLLFQRFLVRNMMISFKNGLMKNLTEL
ncbi:hypothetical protein [Winogradskyella forsetii]|uniref:hypothetical protein n=1 Tax=Winogradskyella forsetii TaxID=2686077 RepID=UPI0015BC3CAA|nr:hypothetical protein [Winogradskyella forsetii]